MADFARACWRLPDGQHYRSPIWPRSKAESYADRWARTLGPCEIDIWIEGGWLTNFLGRIFAALGIMDTE
jgi:hypothetical protein